MANESIEQTDLITKFEMMSNELLMELFEYYDLYSLFFSFGSLNSRILNILHHCHVYANLYHVQSVDFNDFIENILSKINRKNIRSLHTSNSYQLEFLTHRKSLNHSTKICSLSLSNIQSNVIEHMVLDNDFSHLERILLDKYGDKYECKRSFFMEGNFKFQNKFSQLTFLSPIRCHHRLTHLNLEFHEQICLKIIVCLFKCAPRICHLKLNIRSHGHPKSVDPIFWETILSKYLIELKRLSLFVYTTDSYMSTNSRWKFIQNKDEICEQMKKSYYWSSHQWTTMFNSGIPMPYINYYWAKFQVI